MSRMVFAFFLVAFPATAKAVDPIELTAELNVQRARFGLPSVSTDVSLCGLCQAWANHMATTGIFAHSKSGGEHIIAKGQSSAREVIQDWLNSPGHRAYLLSRNTSVGWGVAAGRDGKMVWSGAFGNTSTSTTTSTTAVTATGSESVCTTGSCAGGATVLSTITTTTKTRTKIRERERGRLFGGRCR